MTVADLLAEQLARDPHAGAQCVAVVDGSERLNLALGTARADGLQLWLSAGKPVAAAATLLLAERGLLELDDPVAAHLPEFGAGGKGAITFRHLLAHTAGLHRAVDYTGAPSRAVVWHALCQYERPADWVPGHRCAYDPASAWHVLGEAVERLTALPYGEFVREELFLPLGMPDCWAGLPPAAHAAYAAAGRLAGLGPAGQPKPPPTPEATARFRPGSNTRGPAAQMVRLIELLGRGGLGRDGRRVLAAASVAELRRPQHALHDETFNHPLRWGLGLILNSATPRRRLVPYGYGPHASPQAFGHGGAQCAALLHDPAHGLSVALAYTHQPGEPTHQRRTHALLAAVYEEILGGCAPAKPTWLGDSRKDAPSV